MTRTPKLSTNMLNSGVARWRGRKRAPKQAQTLISGVVVAVAGRRWAKPQKRAVVLAFRAGGTVRPKGWEKFILKGGIPKKQLLRL